MDDGKGRLRQAGLNFVGRKPEIQAALNRIGEVRDGRPWLILVEGAAGIGKTALTSRLVAELAEFTVLRAYCAHEESDLAYGVVDQLRAQAPAAEDGKPRGLTGQLAQAPTPVLVGTDLLRLIGELQADGPVAIVIEDIQWSDKPSAQALGFVMRRLYSDQVLTLLTARTGAEAPEQQDPAGNLDGDRRIAAAEASPGWSWLASRDLLLRLRLNGLEAADVRELAALANIPLSESDAERLRSHTGGNALYVNTLLAQGPIQAFADRGPLPVPRSLAAALDRQLAALPTDSRALLEAIAVLDSRNPLSTVAELAGVPDPTGALDPLVASGLVRWYPADPLVPIEIPHPLQRNAVYTALSPRRRADLHGKAVDVVPRRASWAHRVAATDQANPALAAELETEASDLIRHGQSDRAATYLLWAADMSSTRIDVERLVIKAALVLFVSGNFTRFNTMEPRVKACSPSMARDLAMGFSALNKGDFRRAMTAFQSTLSAAREPDAPPDAAEFATLAAHTVSSAFVWLGENLDEAVKLSRETATLGAVEAQQAIRAARTPSFAILLNHGPRAALADMAANSGLPADPRNAGGRDAHILVLRGGSHALAGDLRAAVADLTQALRLADADPVALGDFEAHFFLATALYLLGEWPDAGIHAEQACAIATTEEVTWGHQQSQMIYALTAAGRGEWATAEEATATARKWFELTGPPQWIVFCSTAAGAVAAARGDHAGTLDALAPLPAQRTRPYSRNYRSFWMPLLAEAQVATRALEPAQETLGWVTELAEEVTPLRPAVAWLAGRLAEARGDAAAADRAYAAGLAIPHTPDDASYYRARLEHAYGRLLAALGHRKTAGELLDSARTRFAAMDARPYLHRVDIDLADLHLPHPDSRADPLYELTERERDVARLVAEGLTNAETGARLYLSGKTVEYHLAHIYTKLGITSRRQLRDLSAIGS